MNFLIYGLIIALGVYLLVKKKKLWGILVLICLIPAFLIMDLTNVIPSPVKSDSKYNLLVLGIDNNWAMSGNADDNMLIQIDDANKLIKIVSIPRGSNTVLACTKEVDQIRYAYAIDQQCAIDTFENIYDIAIDDYFVLNMNFIIEATNAIGGIDIDVPAPIHGCSPLDGYGDVWLDAGQQHLDGYETLTFLRERNSCGENEYYTNESRIKNIQLVLNAITNKSITDINIPKILDLTPTYNTSLSSGDLIGLANLYLKDNYTLEFKTVSGAEANNDTKAIPDYILDENSLKEVIDYLH